MTRPQPPTCTLNAVVTPITRDASICACVMAQRSSVVAVCHTIDPKVPELGQLLLP
jgi:hypothetical protein